MKTIRACLLGIGLALAALGVHAQGKPAELKLPFATFLSGPASVFGLAGKAGAEIQIDLINASGGVDGVKIRPIIMDEGVGGDRLLAEYRRLVQEEGVSLAIAAVSSGNCKILAPVAEDLKVVNLMWGCGSEKILEDRRFKYVLRPGTNSTADMAAAAFYLLRTKPNFKTLAVINQDYAFGRDAWEVFIHTLRALKPDVQVVAELFPKFGSTDFSSEISRLQALNPDVIFSSTWGGELDTLVRQASQRGLMKSSTWVMPLGESSLGRLGKTMPDGVIVGMRGDYYADDPAIKGDPALQAFVEKYKAKTGQLPIFPAFQAAAAVQAAADGYKAAIKANGGAWPSTIQVADAMRKLKVTVMGRSITMREDGQGQQDELLGVTKLMPGASVASIQSLTLFPADLVLPPVGMNSLEWAKNLKPDVLKSPRIKTY